MKVRMLNLGGALGPKAYISIGATCYLLIIELFGREYVFLIDLGMETSDDDQASWQTPLALAYLKTLGKKIDFILITHAHRDHVGALPILETLAYRDVLKPETQVIATRPTKAFTPHVLYDQRVISDKKEEEPPYRHNHIRKMLGRFAEPVLRPGMIELVPDTIWVDVERAGHIRGACSFTFHVREGRKLVKLYFSGDNCTHNQVSTLGSPLPAEDRRPDIICSFDCTNGSEHLARTWEQEIERMADDGFMAIKKGEWFFTFAFAMDRCHTFAQALAQKGLPVFLDGPSVRELGKVMLSADGFWCEGDRPIDMSGVGSCEYVGYPLTQQDPCAIVAPSGMGHGPALRYLLELLRRPNAVVGGGGYQAPGTNGYKVVRAKPGDKIALDMGEKRDPVEVEVQARCEHYRATAHSLREAALERMHRLVEKSCFRREHGGPRIGLCHGPTKALNYFTESLRRMGYTNTYRADRLKDRDIMLVE